MIPDTQFVNGNIAEAKQKTDRGWGIMEQSSVALIIIVVIAIVVGSYYMLRGRTNVATETSNIQTIITSSQGLLKSVNGYNFTSSTKMTGTLIQMGGVPKTMTISGTASSGSAKLYNSWGGDVTIAPSATAGTGFNNGFTVTYDKVPLDACVQLSAQISKGGTANVITVNGTAHSDGIVTTEEASSQCKADSGSTGTNKLIFTVNG
ncbi:pilus assembly protein PilX [Salmonella enterica]|nr:pilus assembly protein PilX [Salmonella enterica]